jgi:glucose/arabinose dehydrogenase
VYITNAGDGTGRLFVVEQGGLVKVISGNSVVAQPYLDLSGAVSTGGERGLLGMAFAPDFKSSGHVYVDYTDTQGNTLVARFTAKDPSSNSPAWSAPQVVLAVNQPFANHNGGCLQFGPDKMLYIGMGDGGSAGDPQGRAQNPGVRLGKLLRVDTGDAGVAAPKPKGFAVPADNPFVNKKGYLPEIWALGVRNPWRFSFDAKTSELWIGDVGQDAWEEIDVAPAGVGGQNWGWNLWEGTHPYPGGANPSRKGFTFPVAEYPHPQGESVTGGYVYRGTRQPALVGTYLYADFVKGWIGGVRLDSPDGTPRAAPEDQVLLKTPTKPSSFGVDEDNELYLVDYEGTIWTVVASAK